MPSFFCTATAVEQSRLETLSRVWDISCVAYMVRVVAVVVVAPFLRTWVKLLPWRFLSHDGEHPSLGALISPPFAIAQWDRRLEGAIFALHLPQDIGGGEQLTTVGGVVARVCSLCGGRART